MPGTERPRRRRQPDPAAQARAAQARQDRLEALHQQLADGVAAITDGPAWRDWLDLAGRFHHYSFGNQLLIAAQRPDATQVAGYRAWQALGRHVRKGETAIWVLAPIQRRTPANTDTGAHSTASDDADQAHDQGEGQGGRRIVAWTGAAIFDVSQTEGDPLPTPPTVQLLAGQAPDGLWDSLEQAITARGFTVARCPDATAIRGANGLTDLLTRTVTVRADVSDAQAVKTLAHEAGHVLLHTPDLAHDTAMPECLDLVEVEAESVAYLVAAHHGLDTADYTFGYIAGWAGRDGTAVQATAQRVLTATRTLLAHTDPDTTPTVSADLAQHASTAASAVVALADRAAATKTAAGTLSQSAAETLAQRSARGRPPTSLTPREPVSGSPTANRTDRRVSAAASPNPPEAAEAIRGVLAGAQAWFLGQSAIDPRYLAAVQQRGHSPDSCRGDGIGWAPATWTGLVDHLRDLGHAPDQILDSGVAILARGRLIDRFRGRVTFPIHDPHGVVGWTARDTLGRADTPKYLNTPASPLYDKSRLLFGTPHLPSAGTVVLVEGPWDAYAVTRAAGHANIGLATCGTAVTAHQLQLSTSTHARLILGVDNDQAGLTALRRTLALTRDLGIPHPDAVRASRGKDLADQYAVGGPDAVISDLDLAQPAGLVHADLLLALHPPGETAEARVAAARAAAAQADGLIIGDRGKLAYLLIARIGLTPEAAIEIAMPPKTSPAVLPADSRGTGLVPARPSMATR